MSDVKSAFCHLSHHFNTKLIFSLQILFGLKAQVWLSHFYGGPTPHMLLWAVNQVTDSWVKTSKQINPKLKPTYKKHSIICRLIKPGLLDSNYLRTLSFNTRTLLYTLDQLLVSKWRCAAFSILISARLTFDWLCFPEVWLSLHTCAFSCSEMKVRWSNEIMRSFCRKKEKI